MELVALALFAQMAPNVPTVLTKAPVLAELSALREHLALKHVQTTKTVSTGRTIAQLAKSSSVATVSHALRMKFVSLDKRQQHLSQPDTIHQ